MRINWKKRLGVCGGLTLLCLTVIAGAFALPAAAATGELAITGQFSGTDLPASAFSIEVVGSAGFDQITPFPDLGTIILTLDDAQTYTVVPVPMAGFTAVVHDTTGITCTNVTITSTQAFCLVTFTAIPPSTTTTTTTTTTTLPATTTTGKAGQTTVTGSHFDSNQCTSHLDPNLQADAKLRIGATLSSDASPQPHFGDPITLSNTKIGLDIPAGLIQAGVNLELIKNNDQVPSTVTVGVTAENTTEHTHTYVIQTIATIHTVPVAVSTTYPKGQKALPLHALLALPDTHWTPVNGTSDVFFSQNSLKILSHLSLPGIGPVLATFTCSPSAANTSFVALGATGAPATSGGGTGGGTTPTSAAAGSGGGVTPAAAGGGTLPRTGSNPWPLVVLAAICLDLGLLAVAGAKRGRRLLHR